MKSDSYVLVVCGREALVSGGVYFRTASDGDAPVAGNGDVPIVSFREVQQEIAESI